MNVRLIKVLITFAVLVFFLPQNLTFAQNDKSDKELLEESDSKEISTESTEDSELETESDLVQEQIKNEPSSKKEKVSRNQNSDESSVIEEQGTDEEQINIKEKEIKKKQTKINKAPKYTIGDEGDHVRELKKNLSELGYGNFPSNPSDRYGQVTANVVKDFQQTFGLPVTGEADDNTLDTIAVALSSEYRIGKIGSHIVDLKRNLTQLGYGNFPSNPSERYGQVTANVVRVFQADYNLQPTGIVDELTLDKIISLIESFYQIGDEGEHVVKLKQKLTELGYGNFPSDPSERYGQVTANVVKDFQQTFGLEVTGIANKETLNAIDHALASEYRIGKSGPHVRDLKKDLTQLGFGNFPSNPSDNYGQVTADVVKDFQRQYNLPVTGIADSKTREKIKEVLNPPYRNGDQGLHIAQLKRDLTQLGFGNFPSNPSIKYGNVTTNVVKDFQREYGLKETGEANNETLDMLKRAVENSKYSIGATGPHVRDLKKDLTQLGFGNFPSNPSNNYGKVTANVVKEFQRQYNLPVTGIADSKTREKIKEVLNPPYRNGDQGLHIAQLKRDLSQLGFGNFPSNPSINYGTVTTRVVKEFQKEYNLIDSGQADQATLDKIAELLLGINYLKLNYTLNEAVEIQMNQKAQTDQNNYAWVSKTYIDSNHRVTATNLNVRTQPTTSNEMGNRVLGTLPKGTKVEVLDEKDGWYAIRYNNSAWVHAVREDIRYYLDPKNFIYDPKQKFQFLDLSKPSGASQSVLNNYLSNKGILRNQGKAFIDAARLHGVNDIYLLSHALLETGNGTSRLATGVEVGLDKNGKPQLVTNGNRGSLTNIQTVYNVYGIGAVDSSPLRGGAVRAYEEGWTTVSKAIIGGAEFIGTGYIKNGQNTLYKMRWNPKMNEGMAWKQYATDIGWASKQVTTMYNLYQEIGFDSPILEIPQYKK